MKYASNIYMRKFSAELKIFVFISHPSVVFVSPFSHFSLFMVKSRSLLEEVDREVNRGVNQNLAYEISDLLRDFKRFLTSLPDIFK